MYSTNFKVSDQLILEVYIKKDFLLNIIITVIMILETHAWPSKASTTTIFYYNYFYLVIREQILNVRKLRAKITSSISMIAKVSASRWYALTLARCHKIVTIVTTPTKWSTHVQHGRGTNMFITRVTHNKQLLYFCLYAIDCRKVLWVTLWPKSACNSVKRDKAIPFIEIILSSS